MSNTSSYWRRQRLSRRRVLGASVTTGAALSMAALVGCGGEESDDGDAAATTSGGAATAAATGTSAAASSDEITRGGTYNTFTANDPPSIDINTTPSYAARAFAAFVYSRLYRIDAQPDRNPFEQAPVGDLAESAETDDGMTWTVKLKQGVKFQNLPPLDGRELTTEDVLFSWDQLTAPTSTLAGAVDNIGGVEAVDDYTLTFTHDAPNADFLEQMADGFLFWVTPTESEGGFNPAEKAIGTGPWIMDSYEVANRFVFSKNPDYFVEGVPYMDGVVQAIIPEYATQLAQFQAGNVANMGVSSDDVLTVRSGMPEAQWLARTGTTMWGLFFSPEEVDPEAVWRDERFRFAASYAINRGELLEFLYNNTALKEAGLDVTTDWNNQVSVGMGARWWLDPTSEAQGPSAKYFQHDPAEARKLLDALGVSGDTPITYQFTNNRYGATFGSAAEAVQGDLAEAGFPTVVETQDYSSEFITQTWQGRFNGISLGNFGGFSSLSGYLGEQIGDHPDNKRLLHTPDMLDLYARQAREIDVEARAELVHDIQRLNAEHMYLVPSTGGGGTGFTAYHANIKGIRNTRGLGGPTEQLAYYWIDA